MKQIKNSEGLKSMVGFYFNMHGKRNFIMKKDIERYRN